MIRFDSPCGKHRIIWNEKDKFDYYSSDPWNEGHFKVQWNPQQRQFCCTQVPKKWQKYLTGSYRISNKRTEAAIDYCEKVLKQYPHLLDRFIERNQLHPGKHILPKSNSKGSHFFFYIQQYIAKGLQEVEQKWHLTEM